MTVNKCQHCEFENPEVTTFCGQCGTRLQLENGTLSLPTQTFFYPKKQLTLGSTITERYQIIEELGKGGMGSVYKVMDKEIQQVVALKILNPQIASDETMIERFRNELVLSRKITHKNVCRMYDISKEENNLFITMEYIQGEDLKGFIRRVGQLPIGKILSIAKQICEGMAEAHRFGVIHRDLKPQNIMIDKQGNAVIMDFGIARSIDTGGMTEAGTMIGTPQYMSPEQVDGKKADQRSDIYSLGIIIYEMATGTTPFKGKTPVSIALKHKTEATPNPIELNAQIPEGLKDIIFRCMEKEKEQRYQSTEEVLADIKNIEQGLPTAERTYPKEKIAPSQQVTVQLSLKKRFIPIFAVLGVVIIAGIFWLIKSGTGPTSSRIGKISLAVMYFENNTGDDELDHWKKAISDLFIADLSQSKFIDVLSAMQMQRILSEIEQLDAGSLTSGILDEVASRGKVDHLLLGSYAKADEEFRIITTLQEAQTGKLIGSESAQGRGEESIFRMVDDLTRKIKSDFDLSKDEIENDIDKDVGMITTNSPEAFKDFSEGIRHGNAGNFKLSIQFLENAIAKDPKFASAIRSLAIAYGNMGYKTEEKNYIQKALALTDRISDRERYQIEGDFYWQSEKTYDKAIEAFQKLLDLYPGSKIANTNLGLLYSMIEDWDKAIQRLETNKKNRVETFPSYVNLAIPYMAKGDYEKAREALKFYLDNFKDHPIIHDTLALLYLCQNKFGLALDESDKSTILAPNLYINYFRKGDIYLAQGNFEEAENEYQKLIDSREEISNLFGIDRQAALYLLKGQIAKAGNLLKLGIEQAEMVGEMEMKTDFHLHMAFNSLLQKDYDLAVEECNKAWRIGIEEERLEWQLRALCYKGICYLEMNALDKAQEIADDLMGLIPRDINRKKIRYYDLLIGKIALKKENDSEAMAYFEKALSQLHSQHWPGVDKQALFLFPLVGAAFKTGDLEKSLETAETILNLSTGRLYYGDMFAKSFYMLGKIYQKKGWMDQAIEQYDKFLNLWNSADPIFPEIIDAQKQLIELKK